VIGPVDNLFEWYRLARFVIAPIFDGSGMKTKVAEAMMYGKKVVGTPEAFSGYEVGQDAGWVCRTPDDFVAAINEACKEIHSPFDPQLRNIYLQKYSFEAAKKKLEAILS
jgi:glycosyltransferase involved in cell wall biosynthesis